MESYVYILAHATQPRFKIGKADDILLRAHRFDIATLDLLRSVGLLVSTEHAARNLERILLRVFKPWRLSPDAVLSTGGLPEGATEWFSDECRPRLESFLQSNADLFAHKRISGGDLLDRQRDSLRTVAQRANDRREAWRRIRAEKMAAYKRSYRFEMECKRSRSERILWRHQRNHDAQIIRKAKKELRALRPTLDLELEAQIARGTIAGVIEDRHGEFALVLRTLGRETKSCSLWNESLAKTIYGGRGHLRISAVLLVEAFESGRIAVVRFNTFTPNQVGGDLDSETLKKIARRVLAKQLLRLKTLPRIECYIGKRILAKVLVLEDAKLQHIRDAGRAAARELIPY